MSSLEETLRQTGDKLQGLHLCISPWSSSLPGGGSRGEGWAPV